MKLIQDIKKDWNGLDKIISNIDEHIEELHKKKSNERKKYREHQRRISEHLRKTKKYLRLDLDLDELINQIEELEEEINLKYVLKKQIMVSKKDKIDKLEKLRKKIEAINNDLNNKIDENNITEKDFEIPLKSALSKLVNIRRKNTDVVYKSHLKDMIREIKKTCGIKRYPLD